MIDSIRLEKINKIIELFKNSKDGQIELWYVDDEDAVDIRKKTIYLNAFYSASILLIDPNVVYIANNVGDGAKEYDLNNIFLTKEECLAEQIKRLQSSPAGEENKK